MRRCRAQRDSRMGRTHGVGTDAGADAVVLTLHVGEGLGGGAQVQHGEAIGFQESQDVCPGCDRGELFARDKTHIPSEDAEGMVIEPVAKFCFSEREHQHLVLVNCARSSFRAWLCDPWRSP